MTPAGIKPATFRFVAQHLNHCATAVPNLEYTTKKFYISNESEDSLKFQFEKKTSI